VTSCGSAEGAYEAKLRNPLLARLTPGAVCGVGMAEQRLPLLDIYAASNKNIDQKQRTNKIPSGLLREDSA